MTCVMAEARAHLDTAKIRPLRFVCPSTVCREILHAVIENGSANCVASAGALLLCCSYCRTRYVRMSEPFNNTRN